MPCTAFVGGSPNGQGETSERFTKSFGYRFKLSYEMALSGLLKKEDMTCQAATLQLLQK